VPTVSPWGLVAGVALLTGVGLWALKRRGLRGFAAVLLVLGGAVIVWAVTIVLDGQVWDWNGIPPLGVRRTGVCPG